jgi:hypothetical protein
LREQQVRREQHRVGRHGEHPVLGPAVEIAVGEPSPDGRIPALKRDELHGIIQQFHNPAAGILR